MFLFIYREDPSRLVMWYGIAVGDDDTYSILVREHLFSKWILDLESGKTGYKFDGKGLCQDVIHLTEDTSEPLPLLVSVMKKEAA